MQKPMGFISIARALELDVNGYQNYVVLFPRAKWLLVRNAMFEQNFIDKTEKNMHHTVPIYNVIKNDKKIGIVLPRFDDNDKPFLFIPRTYNKRRLDRMNSRKTILRDYYIFEVNDDFEIDSDAKLTFFQ
tara:strand:- start:66 stop:455 length:390 start_codon:yes stop_codon:yes gene_type:complete